MGQLEQKHLTDYCGGITKEQKAIMNARRMDASGESQSLLAFRVKGNVGTNMGPEHIEFMERGRGPGKAPPPEKMLAFVKAKPIQSDIPIESLAFLIGRSIGEKGTLLHQSGKRSGILSKVITEERSNTFFAEYFKDKRIQIRTNFAKAIRP